MTLAPHGSASSRSEPGLDPAPPAWSRWWPTVVLVSTVLTALAMLTGAPEVVRAPIVVWFLVFCPGMAIVRLVRLDDPLAEVMLAFAVSLALAGLVPGVFLYLGAWSPVWSLVVLLAVTTVGLALDPVLARDRRRRGSAPSALSGDVAPADTVAGLPAADQSAGAARPPARGRPTTPARERAPHARPVSTATDAPDRSD